VGTVRAVTRLLLVRHGESNSTVGRMIAGHRSCTGLSPLGIRQSEALHDRWVAHPEATPDVVIASNYARAQETARLVCAGLGWPEIEVVDGFGEHDPGPECDGLSFAEYLERFEIGADAWEAGDPFGVTFPGGETVAAFHYRVGTTLAEVLAANPDRTVLVFCHGGVINAVLRQAFKAPAMGAFETFTTNAAITELQLVRPGLWRLLRYNDAAHLVELPLSTMSIADD
jgi:2,3-bisphosphoglycerate-dependent phosphoglycerate mutase